MNLVFRGNKSRLIQTDARIKKGRGAKREKQLENRSNKLRALIC